MTDDAGTPHPLRETPIEALKMSVFTGFGVTATILGFVFMPPAGALIAALVGWKRLEQHYRLDGPPPLRVLSLVLFTGFATVATIMGFVFMPPAGALLAVLFLWWGFGTLAGASREHAVGPTGPQVPAPSANRSFDAHRAGTLRRLEEEQQAFETFIKRLRAARDAAEFDDFMDERAWNRSGRRRP